MSPTATATAAELNARFTEQGAQVIAGIERQIQLALLTLATSARECDPHARLVKITTHWSGELAAPSMSTAGLYAEATEAKLESSREFDDLGVTQALTLDHDDEWLPFCLTTGQSDAWYVDIGKVLAGIRVD